MAFAKAGTPSSKRLANPALCRSTNKNSQVSIQTPSFVKSTSFFWNTKKTHWKSFLFLIYSFKWDLWSEINFCISTQCFRKYFIFQEIELLQKTFSSFPLRMKMKFPHFNLVPFKKNYLFELKLRPHGIWPLWMGSLLLKDLENRNIYTPFLLGKTIEPQLIIII